MPLDGTTYDNDPIIQEIRKAKQTLLEKGWCQGAYQNRETGAVCLAGSFGLGVRNTIEIEEAAFRFVEKFCISTFNLTVTNFNDHSRRIPKEVLALLDLAIEKRLQEITVTV